MWNFAYRETRMLVEDITENLLDSCPEAGVVSVTTGLIPESPSGSAGLVFSHLVIYLRAPHRKQD